MLKEGSFYRGRRIIDARIPEFFKVIKAGDPGWYFVVRYVMPEAEEIKPYICTARKAEWYNMNLFERIGEVTDPMKGYPQDV